MLYYFIASHKSRYMLVTKSFSNYPDIFSWFLYGVEKKPYYLQPSIRNNVMGRFFKRKPKLKMNEKYRKKIYHKSISK